MSKEKNFPRVCAICLSVPQVPKVLPCYHIYCIGCLDQYITSRAQSQTSRDDGDDGRLLCPECKRPFSCLPKPEAGCEPVGSVHQDFTSDAFLLAAQCCGVIDDIKCKVMGLAVLGDLLYVVYHKQSTVYMYNAKEPYGRVSAADLVVMKWPRGMAASHKYRSIYVTDWCSMFAGRLWCLTERVTQFHVVAELDVQPFGISVCEESDRLIVTCSTPLRHAVPFVSKSSRLLIFAAATGALERVVSLDSSYEIPRHALAIGHCFVVCHGWLKCGKVVSVDESGRQQPGCYGSQVKSGEQSLSRPLSLYNAGENHILVTDYHQHRVHLVTHQMQFVRHLVAKAEATTIGHDRGITYPRQICLNDGFLYVGAHSGVVGIYRVQ